MLKGYIVRERLATPGIDKSNVLYRLENFVMNQEFEIVEQNKAGGKIFPYQGFQNMLYVDLLAWRN